MDPPLSRNPLLESEVKVLRGERDKFRQLLVDAEAEAAKWRIAYLKLENESEKERRELRTQLEIALADAQAARNETALVNPKPKEVIELDLDDNDVNPEMNSKRNKRKEPKAQPVPSPSKPQVPLPQTPKASKTELVDIKVLIKVSSSPKHKVEKEKVSIDQKKKQVAECVVDEYTNDLEYVDPPDSASSDNAANLTPSKPPLPSTSLTPKERRPIRASSPLPVTMAQHQSAESPVASPSLEKPQIKVSATKVLRKTVPGKPPVTSSTPAIAPSALEHQQPHKATPVKPQTKTPVTNSQHQTDPSDPQTPPPAATALKKQEVPFSPSIPMPKALVVPSDNMEGKVKVKVKAEGHFTLSRTEVSKYLRDAASFIIEPPPRIVQVSRKALTEEYRLPGMGLLWRSKDERHQFLLPTVGLNPEMPRSPGAPGLLMSSRSDMCEDGPWTLFIKAQGAQKVKRMDYAGEYKCKTVGKMTKEKFASQEPTVKQNWGEKIAEHKLYPVYRKLRARMTLRKKFGTEPTEEEVRTEADLIKAKDYTSCLTKDDVVEAFERGDEHIGIVKLECVSYNHQRAEDFATAQTACERREREKALLPTEGRKRKGKGKPKGKNKKARLEVPSDEVDELVESEEDIEMQEVPPIAVSRPVINSKDSESELSELTDLFDSD